MPTEVLVTIPFSETLISQIANLSSAINVTAITAQTASEISAEIWARTEILYTGNVLPAHFERRSRPTDGGTRPGDDAGAQPQTPSLDHEPKKIGMAQGSF
ncbi:MAG: hypothetical protein NT121_00680 [Chloroflexi bacterium]|nr:hypothetical protein [Chloroflexota bacterium]